MSPGARIAGRRRRVRAAPARPGFRPRRPQDDGESRRAVRARSEARLQRLDHSALDRLELFERLPACVAVAHAAAGRGAEEIPELRVGPAAVGTAEALLDP